MTEGSGAHPTSSILLERPISFELIVRDDDEEVGVVGVEVGVEAG